MDERLRARERQADQDPAARVAWIHDLLRAGDARALEALALDARLRDALADARARVDAELAGRFGARAARCPELDPALASGVIRAALGQREGLGPSQSYAYRTLARLWPAGRATLEHDPIVVVVFAARLDPAIHVRVGFTDARKPSPGTTWPALAPWREGLSPEVVERRLRAWTLEPPPAQARRQGRLERATVELARWWLEVAEVVAGRPAVP